MSQPTLAKFFIVIFREDQTGPQHKVLTSLGGLVKFIDGWHDDKVRADYNRGPFDVYFVNVEALECGRYDVVPLIRASAKAH
jgi:hypothetical protein